MYYETIDEKREERIMENILFVHRYNLIIFVLFSEITFKHLKGAALDAMRTHREHNTTQHDEFLVPNDGGIWGNKAKLNKTAITLAMAEKTRKKWFPTCDQRLMEDFLTNVTPGVMSLPGIAEPIDFMPPGAPIIDFIRAYRTETYTWEIPSSGSIEQWSLARNVANGDLDGLEVREIYIGKSTREEVLNFILWFNEQHQKNQDDFPSGVVSLDVEMVQVTHRDYQRLADPSRYGTTIPLSKKPGQVLEGDSEATKRTKDAMTAQDYGR